jgi:hypothetical protein
MNIEQLGALKSMATIMYEHIFTSFHVETYNKAI